MLLGMVDIEMASLTTKKSRKSLVIRTIFAYTAAALFLDLFFLLGLPLMLQGAKDINHETALFGVQNDAKGVDVYEASLNQGYSLGRGSE